MGEAAIRLALPFETVFGHLALAARDPDRDTAPAPSAAQTIAPAPEPFRIGDAIEKGAFRITITEVSERRQVGSGFIAEAASEGGVLVAVTYSVANISDRPQRAYSAPRIHLVDPNGVRYDYDAGKTASFTTEQHKDRKLISDLNPGIRTYDAVVFEVSEAAFDPATWRLQIGNDKAAQVLLSASADGSAADPRASAAASANDAAAAPSENLGSRNGAVDQFTPDERVMLEQWDQENSR